MGVMGTYAHYNQKCGLHCLPDYDQPSWEFHPHRHTFCKCLRRDVLGYIQIGILGKVESVLFAHRRILYKGESEMKEGIKTTFLADPVIFCSN